MTEGVQHTTSSFIAAAMNSHFTSIGKTLADKIYSAVAVVSSTPVMSQPTPAFQLNHVDEDTVLNHLLSLKTNKAIGLDFISARLLKYGAHAICRSVTRLLNLSISSGKFPDIWKCSKVSALFKCGDRTNPTNYRPISILPTLSKIMEKVVHSQLYKFLNSQDLLSSKQFGFRPK